MNTRLLFSIFLFLISGTLVYSQKPAKEGFKIVFYNVENLYDTIDDPHKNDNEFLPTSKVAWTSERMYHKIHNIGKVLVSIDSVNLPAVIGLAEVENNKILEDLVDQTRLRNGHYQAILEEGADPRGIDVALLYRPEILKYISHKAIPAAKEFKTRFILYIKLADVKKDTFHIFINHWKSREGGQAETEAKRIENAEVLKHSVDSLFALNPKVNIIIMGDFNDEPGNTSIATTLGAKQPGKKPVTNSLYDLLWDPFVKGDGTLFYKDWDVFDQIIVSGNLLTKKRGKGPVILPPYAYIHKLDWMLYKNKNGVMVPNRTASSREYFGGYSDHLPVFTIIN
jgi:endonuclease/exonuclease/phosphatase family metal-dependent hydrolase